MNFTTNLARNVLILCYQLNFLEINNRDSFQVDDMGFHYEMLKGVGKDN